MKQGYNEDWIDQIRLEIYEEIKDMTSEERTEYFRSAGEKIAQKYGVKVVPSANYPFKPLFSRENTSSWV